MTRLLPAPHISRRRICFCFKYFSKCSPHPVPYLSNRPGSPKLLLSTQPCLVCSFLAISVADTTQEPLPIYHVYISPFYQGVQIQTNNLLYIQILEQNILKGSRKLI